MAQNKLPTCSKDISNDEYDIQIRDIIKFYVWKFELCVHHIDTIDTSERKTSFSNSSNLTKDAVYLFKYNLDDITEVTINFLLALIFTTYPRIRHSG